MEIFLARVKKVYIKEEDFSSWDSSRDMVIIYNDNENFSKINSRILGVVDFIGELRPAASEDFAFPFDKNQITYPIVGETIIVLKIGNINYWLPFSISQYPNFRENYITTLNTAEVNIEGVNNTNTTTNYNSSINTGIPQSDNTNSSSGNRKKYIVKENIKFLRPKEGDTIIQGRVGNSIRFSESFLVSEENPKDPSPSIIIRNKQSDDASNKNIGELVEEDITKDGSSIYMTSQNIIIPYNHTNVSVQKEAWGDTYPKELKGNQIYINSDRILLSAKAQEFIIFGKNHTGIITDGNFTVDSGQNIKMYNKKDITFQSGPNQKIFLNSQGGKIYLGNDKGPQKAGSDVQNMVLGNDLFQILDQLLTILASHGHPCSCGGESKSTQAGQFISLKGRLNRILSKNNFLSK